MPLHLFCRHDEMPALATDDAASELQVLAAQYRLGVETQMHFNQLILRTRVLGITGAVVVMGTALLFRVQYPAATPVSFFGWVQLSPATLIALFGPGLLFLGLLMDRFYYLRLLGGASRYLYRLEDQLAARPIAGVEGAFRQATFIREAFGKRIGASTKFVWAAYMLVAVAEVIVILLLATNP